MKTCPCCGEILGDSLEICFHCKYNFRYGRVVTEGEKITPQDITYLICRTNTKNIRTNETIGIELSNLIEQNKIDQALNYIQDYFNSDERCANEILELCKKEFNKIENEVREMLRKQGIQPLTQEQKSFINEQDRLYRLKQQNIPKCPTCQSTNIKKISTLSKVAGASMFGLFSKTARSQFQCINCGYKW